MTHATGVDPAGTGCAARADVLVRDGVYILHHWRAVMATKRRDHAFACSDGLFRLPHDARAWLVAHAAPLVVVEETPAFMRRRASGGAVVRALVTQAEGAGAIVQAVGACTRVAPEVWRRDVLRVAGDADGAAALAAWGWATVHRRLALDWRGEACEAPPAVYAEHVAEAACCAVWLLRRS